MIIELILGNSSGGSTGFQEAWLILNCMNLLCANKNGLTFENELGSIKTIRLARFLLHKHNASLLVQMGKSVSSSSRGINKLSADRFR